MCHVVETFMAKSKSQKHLSGREEEELNSVKREVHKKFLMDKVFLAIRKKVPIAHTSNIVIPQDNFKPNVATNDPDILEALSKRNIVLQ